MSPGEIYFADVPGAGRRPVIVLSRDELNRGKNVLAVLVTSTRFAVRSAFANCVPFRAGEYGFSKDCVAQAETVQPVPRSYSTPSRSIASTTKRSAT